MSKLIWMQSFLAQLYTLPEAQSLVVRGSFILRHWAKPFERRCDDLDLLDTRQRTTEQLLTLVQAVLAQRVPSQDIKLELMDHQIIWPNTAWPGLRIFLKPVDVASTDYLQVDLSQGDPLNHSPIPLWLNRETQSGSQLLIYSVIPEIALAWKIHGLFEHISGNWRSKDLFDVWLLLKTQTIDHSVFKDALALAFSSREDPLEILVRLLYGDFGLSTRAQRAWRQWMKDQPVSQQMTLADCLTEIRQILIPLLNIPTQSGLEQNALLIQYRIDRLKASNTELARLKLKNLALKTKLLPFKAYESIPHLPGSRMTPVDRGLPSHKTHLLTQMTFDPRDQILVHEKLDGSCVGALRLENQIYAIGRLGELCEDSPNSMRQLWSDWVEQHQARLMAVLQPGERLMGEWLALVHGTRYKLQHEPFVVFDLFDAHNQRLSYQALTSRLKGQNFCMAHLLHQGPAIGIDAVLALLGSGHHGSIDPPEGAVWRIERADKVLFLAKYVRPDKIDGAYLPEKTAQPALWNWHPDLTVQGQKSTNLYRVWHNMTLEAFLQ